MSKRSEEAAMKAYPVEMVPLNYQDLIDQFGGKTEIDVNTYPRCLFQQGYEFAEKDLADAAAFSSGPDGFYYGKGYQQGKKDAEKDLGWHSVEESLPEIDEEVIALTNQMHGKELDTARVICFAHRPDPNGWDGRSLSTGKVEHFDVETYNGWNIPGVRYWMPMPKLPEE